MRAVLRAVAVVGVHRWRAGAAGWGVATLAVWRVLAVDAVGAVWGRALGATDGAVGDAGAWEDAFGGEVVGGAHTLYRVSKVSARGEGDAYPSVIEFLDQSDDLASSDSKLIGHRRREVEVDAVKWSFCGGGGGGSHLASRCGRAGLLDHTGKWHRNDCSVLYLLRSVLSTSVSSGGIGEWPLSFAVWCVLVLGPARSAADRSLDDCANGSSAVRSIIA